MGLTSQLVRNNSQNQISSSGLSGGLTSRLRSPQELKTYRNSLNDAQQSNNVSSFGDFKLLEQTKQDEEKKWQEGVDNPAKRDAEWRRINQEKLKQRMQNEQDNKSTAQKVLENVQSKMKETIFGKDLQNEVGNNLGVNTSTGNKPLDVATNVVGTGLGYAMPLGEGGSLLNATSKLGEKAVAKVGSRVTSKIAQKAIKGAAETAPLSLYSSATQGEDAKTATKRLVTESALGAAGEVGAYGVSRGYQAIRDILKKPVKDIVNSTAKVALEEIKPADNLIAKSGNGSYKIKNVGYEKALNDYNSAIKTIQDHFGTNELRVDEVKKIKSELGINLTEITDRLAKYETKTSDQLLNDAANSARLKRVSGLGSDKSYSAMEKAAQGSKNVSNISTSTIPENGTTNIIDRNTPFYKSQNTKPVEQIQQEIDNLNAVKSRNQARISEVQKAIDANPSLTPGAKMQRELEIGKLNKAIADIEDKLKVNLQLFAEKQQKTQPIVTPTTEQPLPDTTSKIVFSTDKSKKSPKDWYNEAYRKIVDSNAPVKNISENTYMLATNSKNVGGTVDYIFQEGLANKNGETIGKSLKDIAQGIPKNQEKEFWDYMLHKHNIARAGEGKNVWAEFTPEMSAQKVKQYETQFPQFQKPAKEVRNFLDTFMNEWGKKTGLVSDDLMKELKTKYPDYIPTQRAFDEIEKNVVNFGKNGFVDQVSPIKTATNSDRDVMNPLENIMNLVNSTVRTARYNEVGQSLLDAVIKAPEKLSQLAEVIPSKEGAFANTDNVVTVMVKGKPTYLRINNKPLLETMKGIYSSPIGSVEKFFKKVTGVFKSLITQKNPIFAIRNISRDIPTAQVYGSENNPIKFSENLLNAGKDLATNSEAAKQYRALGGGGSNFFNANNVTKSAETLVNGKNIGGKILDNIEYFNNLTESTPRLAEFKKVFKETGDAQKALYAASDITTNFSRGGSITKHVDSFVPYLNAGVQGLDKLARSLDPRKPSQALGTLIKGGIAITAPTAFFHYLNKDNPNYKALDNRTKDNYYLIPYGDTFIKIPKSRELGVLFGSLFERLGRQVSGEKDAFKGFANTAATNFSPANPLENNIASPYYNLQKNKDFAGRTIVPQNMQVLSPKLQYDEKTSEVAKWFGEQASKIPGISKFLGMEGGLSPKQIDYIIKSYTGIIGSVGIPATTKGGDWTKAITTQFTSDPVYSNQNVTDFYDNYNKLQQKAADKNFTEKIPSKVVTKEEGIKNQFAKYSKQITDINKQIRTLDSSGEAGRATKIREMRKQIIDIAKKANGLIK